MYHSYMPLRSKFGLVAVLLLFTVNAAAAGFCPMSCVPPARSANAAVSHSSHSCHESDRGGSTAKAAHRNCALANVLEMQRSAPTQSEYVLTNAERIPAYVTQFRFDATSATLAPTPPLSPPVSLRI
jgi:hypothetical protein